MEYELSPRQVQGGEVMNNFVSNTANIVDAACCGMTGRLDRNYPL
jgi:hypothetical protein